MRYDRRTFVKTGALALAGTAFLGNTYCSGADRKTITGLQLYSLRDDMGTNPLGTLTRLAQMGYVYLEHASYSERRFYGFPANEFRKIIDDRGLKMISGHITLGRQDWDAARNDFTDSWKNTVEDAATLGQKYIVSPWIDEDLRSDYDVFMAFLEVLNKCGELCKKWDMKFGYHNHDFEFSQKFNGRPMFDIMMENMDPELVVMQIDIGNLFNGGAVAMDVVNRYPGRFENVHAKDVIETGEGIYESTIIGEGVADVRNVLDQIKKTGGARVVIIEQESYQGKTPMECAEIDLGVLRKWNY